MTYDAGGRDRSGWMSHMFLGKTGAIGKVFTKGARGEGLSKREE